MLTGSELSISMVSNLKKPTDNNSRCVVSDNWHVPGMLWASFYVARHTLSLPDMHDIIPFSMHDEMSPCALPVGPDYFPSWTQKQKKRNCIKAKTQSDGEQD